MKRDSNGLYRSTNILGFIGISFTVVLVALLLIMIVSAKASNNKYACAYGKHGIYYRLTVNPRQDGAYVCKLFNKKWHGTLTAGKVGTGRAYCTYAKKANGLSETVSIYANSDNAGHAFCGIYHPKGWHRA